MLLFASGIALALVVGLIGAVGPTRSSETETKPTPELFSASAPPRPSRSLEDLIGSALLPGLGALLVLLGLAYLLDYAIERSWITPGLRALAGLGASLAVAGAAQHPRVARLGIWSDLLAALGFGGAYLSLWYAGEGGAAIFGIGLTLTAGHVLSALAVGCGVGRDRPLLTSAALAAAFLAPLFLGYEGASFLGYFGHAIVLAGAALAASLFRDQTGPRSVAFVGVSGLTLAWLNNLGLDAHAAQLPLIAWILFAFGLAGGLLPALLRGRVRAEDQVTLIAGLLAVAGGLGYAHEGFTLGLELGLVAAILGGLAILVPALRQESLSSLRTQLVVGSVGFASAVPAAVFGFTEILGAFWCLEAAALVALGTRSGPVTPIARTLALFMTTVGTVALAEDWEALVLRAGGSDLITSFGFARFAAWMLAALGAVMTSEIIWKRDERREGFFSLAHLSVGGVLMVLGGSLFAEQLFLSNGLPKDFGWVALMASAATALFALALRARVVGRRALVFAAPVLYAATLPFALLAVAFIDKDTATGLIFPLFATMLVALSGAGLGVLAIGSGLRSDLRGLVWTAPLGFALLAGQIFIWDGLRADAEAIVGPIWWSLGLGLATWSLRRQPGAGPALSYFGAAGIGLLLQVAALFGPRGNEALFMAPTFIGGLIWSASLTLSALGLPGRPRLRDVLAVVSQIVLGLVFLDEVRSWAALPTPTVLGLGEVSTDLADGLISALWALHAAVLVAIGFRFGKSTWRVAGLGLFLVTAVKVLGFDLAASDTLTRVVAAMVVGGAMLAASFLYARRRRDAVAAPERPAVTSRAA